MDTLNLTKQDFKYLLAGCAIVPLISFIAGFHIATNNTQSSLDSSYQKSDVAESSHSSPALKTTQYALQAGLFTNINNAHKLKKSLEALEVDSVITKPIIEDINYFRVSVGSFKSREQAKKRLISLNKAHQLNFYVTKI